jgi:hypothetical protein
MAMNATLKIAAGANRAARLPINAPSTSGNSHALNTSLSTDPRFQCAEKDDNEVGMMIASDVPTHSCMRTSSAIANQPNVS